MDDFTDLQEDILTLAVKHPQMTDGEIADALDCSVGKVGNVRLNYREEFERSQLDDELATVSADATDFSNRYVRRVSRFDFGPIVRPFKWLGKKLYKLFRYVARDPVEWLKLLLEL